MSHEAYSPVGYSYQADNYCLDCIAERFSDAAAEVVKDGDTVCPCTECVLDRAADARHIDRYDEGSFDSGTFPKAIPYYNDIHSECGPSYYGYGPDDPEWELEYCGARCGRCHDVIDGVSQLDGPDVCPAFYNR